MLLATTCFVRAQQPFTLTSAYANVYFNDGNGVVYDSKNGANNGFSGGSLVGGAANGTALVNPLGPSGGGVLVSGSSYSYSSSASSPSPSATALVTYFPAIFYGSNIVNQQTLVPQGTLLSLNNTGSSVVELRLDWTANYNVTAPCTLYVFNQVDFSGKLTTINDFAAVASSESYVVNGGTPDIATCAAGGSYTSYPPALDPSALFYDFGTGYAGGSYNALPYVQGSPSTYSLSSGNSVTINGFIDLLVDPGSAVVKVVAVPPSSIRVNGTNVIVSWPPNGVPYTVQTNSDLRTTNWGNYGNPIIDVGFTNSSRNGNMFYRLSFP